MVLSKNIVRRCGCWFATTCRRPLYQRYYGSPTAAEVRRMSLEPQVKAMTSVCGVDESRGRTGALGAGARWKNCFCAAATRSRRCKKRSGSAMTLKQRNARRWSI